MELDKSPRFWWCCRSKQQKNIISLIASLHWHHDVWVISICTFAQQWHWQWSNCFKCSNWDCYVTQNVDDALSASNKWYEVFELLVRSKASAPQKTEKVFASCKRLSPEQLPQAQPLIEESIFSNVSHFLW